MSHLNNDTFRNVLRGITKDRITVNLRVEVTPTIQGLKADQKLFDSPLNGRVLAGEGTYANERTDLDWGLEQKDYRYAQGGPVDPKRLYRVGEGGYFGLGPDMTEFQRKIDDTIRRHGLDKVKSYTYASFRYYNPGERYSNGVGLEVTDTLDGTLALFTNSVGQLASLYPRWLRGENVPMYRIELREAGFDGKVLMEFGPSKAITEAAMQRALILARRR